MRRKIGLLVLCLFFFGGTCVSYLLFAGPGKPNYPSANGYDTLTEASRLMTELPNDFDLIADPEVLRSIVDANQEAIQLIDQAASEECLVRSGDIMTQQDGIDDSDVIRLPMRLMVVKAHLAEVETRLSDAVDDYLTIYRIADASARGGLLVHHGVATVYEVLAVEELTRLVPHLDDKLMAKIDQSIENSYTPNIENVIAQEKEFLKQVNGRLLGSYMVYGKTGNVQRQRVTELMTSYQKTSDGAKMVLRDRLAKQ